MKGQRPKPRSEAWGESFSVDVSNDGINLFFVIPGVAYAAMFVSRWDEYPNISPREVVWLEAIEVRDLMLRRQGLGSYLLRYAETWCRENGFKGVEGNISTALGTPAEALTRFYRKNGYEVELLAEPNEYSVGRFQKAF